MQHFVWVKGSLSNKTTQECPGGRLHEGPGVDQADSSLEPYQTSLQRPEHVYKRLISIQPDRTGRICTQERENSFKTRYVKLVEEDWKMQS